MWISIALFRRLLFSNDVLELYLGDGGFETLSGKGYLQIILVFQTIQGNTRIVKRLGHSSFLQNYS